jgi:hypothetical protein
MEVAPVFEAPELVAEVPEVRVRDVPEPMAAPEVRGVAAEPRIVATVPTIVPEVRDRPVAAPEAVVTPDFQREDRPEPAVASPRITTRVPDIAARDIPAPAAQRPEATATEAPLATSSDAAPPAQSGREPRATDAAGVASAAPAGAVPEAGAAPTTAGAPGRGPDAAAPPGAWPTTTPGDDWGAAARDRPGAAQGPPGVFDDAGRPRLADGGGVAPGTFEENVADFGNAGEWMQRPAYPYEPTRFDRFWIPGGTLLEEWVRRGIRELMVPIPGTSKRLKCVVSVLQLGGGCWVSDPNLNEQPSTGRPAPEVPFRPELFEDPAALEPVPPGG